MNNTVIKRGFLAAVAFLGAVLVRAAEVPAPADVIGFAPGTDYKLARYEAIARYFRALDAASDRVVVEPIGESTLGKPLLLALISSEENLKNRDRYREISRRLALSKDLDENQARALAREGKAIVWIDGGLHATEVAHGQMTPELAYWVATSIFVAIGQGGAIAPVLAAWAPNILFGTGAAYLLLTVRT